MIGRRSKWLSLFLAFSITILAVAPQTALAASLTASGDRASGIAAQPPSATLHKNVTRVTELVDKRDQHSKTYLNSDGSYTTETSYASRHYQDANGTWQDISNKITSSSDDPAFATSSQANPFHPHFAKNSQAPYLAEVKPDKTSSLSWTLDNAANSSATNDTNSVIFPDILKSTDLQYQPFSDGLKENIIVKNASAPASFTFQLTVTGLTITPQKDGSLAVNDAKSGNTKFVIPRPYMSDQHQETSQAVTMSLTPTKNSNVYTVTITPDAAWIADPSRSFPVVIDPPITTVSVPPTYIGSTGLDTYVNSAAPNTQFYTSNNLNIGWDNGGAARTLLKFALPVLPAGAIATDATLQLNKRNTTTATSEEIDIARVTSPWPYSVTWANQPSVDSTFDVSEQTVAQVAGNTTGWITFNVWSIVKSWLNSGNGDLSPQENDGFMVQFPYSADPAKNHETSAHPAYSFISSNDPDYGSTLSPLLSITYITDELGSNPYWSYANLKGGSVNTMNGNFISSVTDFSLPGRGIPATVTRTYNSRGTFKGLFGQKWNSNLDMQLAFKGGAVVFLDSNGTERPFILNSDGQTYTRPDNYPVQLYMDTSGGPLVYHIQEANSETGKYSAKLPSLTFDSSGKLIKLEDGKGNTTTVSYPSNKVMVTDPSNRTTTLALNGDGTVNSITTSAEPEKTKTSYTYANGYLNSVTYDNSPNGTSTLRYEWDVYHNLLSFTNKNGTKTYLYYDANNRLISSGPVNDLVNPSFEASADGTAPDHWTTSVTQDAGKVQVSSDAAKYAGHSLDLKSVYQAGTSGTSKLWAKQRMSVQPNTPYVLSSYLKTAGLQGIAYLNVEELDSSGNHLKWEDTSGSPLSGTIDWTRKALTINTSATTAFVDVYVEVTHDSNSFGGDAYFDGIQLQDGATATDFQGHTEFRYGTDGTGDDHYQACWVTKASGELTEYENNNYGTPAIVTQDPHGPKEAVTEMVWDAADHLRSLTTPNQMENKKEGKGYASYIYTYDSLGNLLTTTDPLNHTSQMDYYYNHLQNLTEPDNTTVSNVWDPRNLNEDTYVNQTMNSTAYMYDPGTGNLTSQSNQLGLADNRVYNSGFESATASQPTDWTANSPTGTVSNKVEWDATAPFGGSNVLHVNPGSNYNAYQWTDYIPVNGNPYTLSAYLKASGSSGSFAGACINVYWYDSSYRQLPVGSPQTQTYFDARSNQWQRYIAANITPPSGAAYAKVMAVTYGPYDGYFDNIQFEQSPQARGYNFLENSSFIRGNTRWNPSDGNALIFNDGSREPDGTPHAFSDTYDARVLRSTSGTSYLESQTSPTLNAGQAYTIYGFIRTSGITAASGGGARIHVLVTDSSHNQTDYTMPYPVTDTTADPTTPWTKYSFSFKPTVSGTAKVRLELTNASGTAWFDDVRLSPGNLVTQTGYDAQSNYVTSVTDPMSRQTTLVNDAYGQPLSVKSASGEQMQYTYDEQERLLSATDNAGSKAGYTLDADGNVTASNLKAGANTYDQSSFVYDVRDNLTTETDADGKVTTYKYDEGGRLTSKVLPNGSSETFSYDSVDNVSQVQLSSGEKYTYTYDREGRPTDAKTSGTGPTSEIQASYDAIGNLIGYSDGNLGTVSSTSLTRDALNRITQFNLTYGGASVAYGFSYTGNGLPSTVTADSKSFSMIYDDGDQLINRNNPDGTQDVYTYNEAGQVTGVQTGKVDTSKGGTILNPLWSSQYSFDADGRISTVTGTRPSGTSFSENYTYNSGTESLNRLTQAVIKESGSTLFQGSYQYDPAGNLTSMSLPGLGTKTFTYDADNRITNSGFSYDANGNLTGVAMYGTNYQYGYDAENRLTTVKDAGGQVIASYTYDADGNRLSKTANGKTTLYHYFQGQLMYETVDSTITALYLRSSDGKLLGVRLNQNGVNNYYYYHYDAQGDVTAVTDANGAVYRQYVYDPYGNIISVKDGSGNSINIGNDPGFNNAYTYRGYRFDSETGLYFLQSRYYAAGIGRFLTKDTFTGDVKNPNTLNKYTYCGGNPVNYVDPSEHFIFLIPEAAIFLFMIAEEYGPEIEEEGSAFFEELGEASEKSFLDMDLQLFAKKSDLKMVDDAARQVGIDRNLFGEYIHELKAELRMKPSDNFTYKQLINYAQELKKFLGK
ncbi:DNRLRE domain-containing protein [Desulfosporosinus sp. PR]|uniref:DNRLRE domain-containing protein n=1 Tax=Candidatus Desulfosporosinus nitrosoreducens TaxID=3401928 RepID=UPI0027F0D5BF|nr:DNRLRE domain-containing protein [Desulfosporosinus sp. PR]MDQ7095870.1 DNRLRE domain-containing protein [Desulfosporosinus sp. PR]